MPADRNYGTWSILDCWAAVMGAPNTYGGAGNGGTGYDLTKADPGGLLKLGADVGGLGGALLTLRETVADIFAKVVGFADVPGPWRGPAAEAFQRIGDGIVTFMDQIHLAITDGEKSYSKLIGDSGTDLKIAQDAVYSVWITPQNWQWQESATGIGSRGGFPYDGDPYQAARLNQVYGVTGTYFPNYEKMAALARPAVQALAEKYTTRESQFTPLPAEPTYVAAPAIDAEDKDDPKDPAIDINIPPPPDPPDTEPPPDPPAAPDGPDLDTATPPFDSNALGPPGGTEVPGGFDTNGDGIADLDADGNPLPGLDQTKVSPFENNLLGPPGGTEVPGGFDLNGDGIADVDANGNPLPGSVDPNTELSRFQPPELNSPNLNSPNLNSDLPNFASPPTSNLSGDRPPGSVVPPLLGAGGLNSRLPKPIGPGSGLPNFNGRFGPGVDGPAPNLVRSGPTSGPGGPLGRGGSGASTVGASTIGKNGLGGGGGYPPPMHPPGGQGNKEKKERERETWLMEDEEVWGDAGAPVSVLGKPDDDGETPETLQRR